MQVHLVAAGKYHNIDFARLELLKLLAEHGEIRTSVSSDYADTARLAAADLLISYTCDLVPDAEQTRALAEWVERGGRWLALHGTNSLLRFAADGKVDCPDENPDFMALLGTRFAAHPPIEPFKVEVTRGDRVESSHRGAAIVVDAAGKIVFTVGDTDLPVYPRSAVKALLALPLVESGGADRLGLTDAEIALTCSSHSGEEDHVAAATAMLAKAGRDFSALECGTHWPGYAPATHALAAAGRTPTALHNNCSGKHSGFICLACDRGDDPAGYVRPDHPTMRAITAALSAMTSTVLDETNRAIDGCAIPAFAIPLRALALAFARFGSAEGLEPARAAACHRIRAAVAANPRMVAGTDRFDTRVIAALGDRAFVKSGAEGVHCAAIPELGLGIAVKCDDGAGRAADVITATLLSRLLPNNGTPNPTLAILARPKLTNWNGTQVGELRPTTALG